MQSERRSVTEDCTFDIENNNNCQEIDNKRIPLYFGSITKHLYLLKGKKIKLFRVSTSVLILYYLSLRLKHFVNYNICCNNMVIFFL